MTHLQFEAMLSAAKQSTNRCDFALVTMLGLLGLRIFEATGSDIEDLGEEHDHRVLRVHGKGDKVVLVPLPPAEVLVMATGSSDIYNPFGTTSGPSPTTTLGIVGDQIRRVLDAAPTTTTVVWVDTQVCRTSQTTAVQIADQRLTNAVNAQIHSTAPHVVPSSWWLANSSMGGRLGSYLKDGVHPWGGPGTGHSDGTAFWCEIVMKTLRPLLDA